MDENVRHGYVNTERFWQHVEKTETCWLWTGRTTGGPYGKYGLFAVRVQSPRGCAIRLEGAHRIAWELANGPIPPRLFVLHSCDTPKCVRVEHLRVGTHADNMADKTLRNRHWRGGRRRGTSPSPPLSPLSVFARGGERHWCAKATNAQVREIRQLYFGDLGLSVAALARSYGLSEPGMISILKGESRKTAGGPTGLIRPREASPQVVAGANRAAKVRARYAQGDATIYDLAREFSMAPQSISKIIRRERWKDLADVILPTTTLRTHRKLTRRQVAIIRQRHTLGVSQGRLARDYGVSPAAISMLIHRKTHATG